MLSAFILSTDDLGISERIEGVNRALGMIPADDVESIDTLAHIRLSYEAKIRLCDRLQRGICVYVCGCVIRSFIRYDNVEEEALG